MKFTPIFVAVFIILILSSCSFTTGKKVDPKSEYYYYSWFKNKIYFKEVKIYHQWIPIPTGINNFEMKDADAKTFEVLSDVIAKDKNHVYYWVSKVDSADASTFRHVSGHLYKDKNHVYIHGYQDLKILPDADPETFEYYKNQTKLAKDKKGYFCRDKRINVDMTTFEVLSDFAYGGFDKDSVYAFQKTIPEGTAIEGKLNKMNDKLLYDDQHVFYFAWQGKYVFSKFPIKDRKSFVIYASDEKTIFKINGALYWNDRKIENLDVKSFEYPGGIYAKDKNGVYIVQDIDINNVVLLEADPATFRCIDENLACDKYNVYYGRRIIVDADPKTIRKTKEGLKDKNYEWKWNREDRKWVKYIPQ